jgi:pimeloyl-ACP methyl ester carboxylesterase
MVKTSLQKNGLWLLVVFITALSLLANACQTAKAPENATILKPKASQPRPTLQPSLQETFAASPNSVMATAVFEDLIDIGIAKLYIRCVGSGNPTVVLDAGPGYTSQTWAEVVPGAAYYSRVCAYDRAGLGQSSLGTKPRTSERMATELHALLIKANIPGPYILVSHSTSNWISRIFASQYPDEVAGMVFVSPYHEDMISGMESILALYPEDLIKFRQNVANQVEGQSLEDWNASAKQVRAAGKLDGIPLILLARSNFNLPDTPYRDQVIEMLRDQDQQLLELSSKDLYQIVPNTGLFIQEQRPQAVIEAIRQLVEMSRP